MELCRQDRVSSEVQVSEGGEGEGGDEAVAGDEVGGGKAGKETK